MCAGNKIGYPKQSEIMAKIEANKLQPAPGTAVTASLVRQRLLDGRKPRCAIALHCPRAGPLFVHQPFSCAAVVIISPTCIEQAESINYTCSSTTEAFVITIVLQCIVWPILWLATFVPKSATCPLQVAKKPKTSVPSSTSAAAHIVPVR